MGLQTKRDNRRTEKRKASASFGWLSAAIIGAWSAQVSGRGEVFIMQGDWGSAQIVTVVAKLLIEEGCGCDVNSAPLATTAVFVWIVLAETPRGNDWLYSADKLKAPRDEARNLVHFRADFLNTQHRGGLVSVASRAILKRHMEL